MCDSHAPDWLRGLPPVGAVCDMASYEEHRTLNVETDEWGPPRVVRIVWRFARVLAEVDGGDLIVQHLIDHAPKDVLPRLTRVYRTEASSWWWLPIHVPSGA